MYMYGPYTEKALRAHPGLDPSFVRTQRTGNKRRFWAASRWRPHQSTRQAARYARQVERAAQ